MFVWGRFNEKSTIEKLNLLEIKDKNISNVFLGETHIAVFDNENKVLGFGSNNSSQLDGNINYIDDLMYLTLNQKINVENIFLGTDFSFLLDKEFNV